MNVIDKLRAELDAARKQHAEGNEIQRATARGRRASLCFALRLLGEAVDSEEMQILRDTSDDAKKRAGIG